jgi:hypothetical protein
MRSDAGMRAYITVANTIGEVLSETDSVEEQYYLLIRMGECINSAAKAGGFFTTDDFIKWMSSQQQP